jgi:hypothetical protein
MMSYGHLSLYKECPKCGAWSFNQYDTYCSRYATELKDTDRWLAGIADYAKSMLIDFLDAYPDLAQKADIGEIPDYATERDTDKRQHHVQPGGDPPCSCGMLERGRNSPRRLAGDFGNFVSAGSDYPVKNIEQLHVFSVCQHAGMIWREIIGEDSIGFFTAWSPPVPIIRKLAELHKDLVFRLEYYETGMAFRGVVTAKWRDGEVMVEDSSWNMTDEDFKELGLAQARQKIV